MYALGGDLRRVFKGFPPRWSNLPAHSFIAPAGGDLDAGQVATLRSPLLVPCGLLPAPCAP
jgi:hypothetical protein